MISDLLVGLSGILVIGVVAQWVAWRIKLPAILPLLLLGVLIGPVFHFIDPDRMFGDLLFPFVSLSVAIILFEGGLNLRFQDIRGLGRIIWRLNTIGACLNWAVIAWLAYVCLNLSVPLSILIGAILIVTGPTVINPLLRQVRLDTQIASTLKWESIIIDPIGAILALLTFELFFLSELGIIIHYSVLFLVKTLLIGIVLGVVAGYLIMVIIKQSWAPNYLHAPVTLALVIGSFVLSNSLQAESGLLTVTIMGVFLANQKQTRIDPILTFKENVTILLISMVFIILSARLPVYDLAIQIGTGSVLFVLGVIFLARPLNVFVSTWGTLFTWRHKLFLALTAPRGIVAAIISSLFALALAKDGVAEADQLVFITFLVIIVTVIQSGLMAGLLAKWLHVERPHFYGVLIAGAHVLARSIARELQKKGLDVLVVDTNRQAIIESRQEGLSCLHGSILDDTIQDYLQDRQIGRFLALTSNDDLNVLAAAKYQALFGEHKVYRLYPEDRAHRHADDHYLFDEGMTYTLLTSKYIAGATVMTTVLNESYSYADFQKEHDDRAVPLFMISDMNELYVFSKGKKPPRLPRVTLMALVPSQ